jgi:hypothetical protein
MAVAYEKYGSCAMLTAQQSAAAAETITLLGNDINGGNAYSVLGALVVGKAVNGGGASRVDIAIGGANIGSQLTPVAGSTIAYALSSTFADLQGTAGEDITVTTTNGDTQVQVHILISQNVPSDA